MIDILGHSCHGLAVVRVARAPHKEAMMVYKDVPFGVLQRFLGTLEQLGLSVTDMREVAENPASFERVVARLVAVSSTRAQRLFQLFSGKEAQIEYLQELFGLVGAEGTVKETDVVGEHREPSARLGDDGDLSELHLSYLQITLTRGPLGDHGDRLRQHVVVNGEIACERDVSSSVPHRSAAWRRVILRFHRGSPEGEVRMAWDEEVLGFLAQHPRYLEAMGSQEIPAIDLISSIRDAHSLFGYTRAADFRSSRVRMYFCHS